MLRRIKVDQIEYSIHIPLSMSSEDFSADDRKPSVKWRVIGKDGRSKIVFTHDQAQLFEILRTLTVIQHEIDSL